MAKQFGNKYQNLVNKNPGKKSEFNTDPGNKHGLLRIKNPYYELIKKWEFTRTAPSAPFVGRSSSTPIIDVYYVVDGYIDENYVEIQ